MNDNEYDSLLGRAEALGKDIKKIESINIDDAYKLTMGKVRTEHKKRIMFNVMRYAAILAIPLLIATLYFGYDKYAKSATDKVHLAQVNVASGSVIKYELPDNSIVWLNSGSKLTYPTKFQKDKREVTLSGEAYFEVKANKKSPFYVNTPSGMKVYVYGTRFNVSAYDDDNTVETTLESGHVNAISPNGVSMYEIQPGECLMFDKANKTFSLKAVEVDELTAWKDGKLLFRDTSLDEVLKRLSRHFNVDIKLNNHLHKDYQYRATFRDETITQILDYLSKSVTMKWSMKPSLQNQDGTFNRKQIIVDLY
jgi:transmembrane sensor